MVSRRSLTRRRVDNRAHAAQGHDHVLCTASARLVRDVVRLGVFRFNGLRIFGARLVPDLDHDVARTLVMMFGAIGLECKRIEHDVIVEGTAIAE